MRSKRDGYPIDHRAEHNIIARSFLEIDLWAMLVFRQKYLDFLVNMPSAWYFAISLTPSDR